MMASVASILTNEVLLQVADHARTCLPRECCGWIHQSGQVRRCRNIQDQLHKQDPIGWPGDATQAYCMHVDDQLRMMQLQESDNPPRIVYHSHPDGEATFSCLDRERALFGGEPVYRHLSYMVLGCRDHAPQVAALYQWIGCDYEQTWYSRLT